ncbi:MAG: calcium-translocating P-type ATPase YloB [Parcubacteria group bacterium Athens0714_16]|nr:MAG: calcium-translocating P-type ATPase YloB [Parcubacteria group bacterium Athens0714_16]
MLEKEEQKIPPEQEAGKIKITNHTIKWSQIEPKQLEARLNTNFSTGLSLGRVEDVQKRYGRNIITKKNDYGLLGKFFKQFKNPLVLILLLAGIATIFLQEILNSTVIFLALLMNVLIGTFQEDRASRAFEKLNNLQQKYATVIRDGKRTVVKSEEVALGDIVVLESGTNVPADIRILESSDLQINESVFTGEWLSVKKNTNLIQDDLPITEQSNMAWMGTLISSGQGIGVVVEIGDGTQLGHISKSLSEGPEIKTPIQKNIKKLAIFLSFMAIVSVLIIFVLGIIRGESLIEMLLISIAVAVSIVPEGLPAALTVVLAVGMEKILKTGGLVKNILTAEILGSTTIILTDKTGTLTQAKMKATDFFTIDFIENKIDKESIKFSQRKLLEMAVISSDAFTEESEKEGGEIIIHGKPIEKAIVMEGLEEGISQFEMEEKCKRIDFFAFDSENGFAVSLNECLETPQNRMYFSGSTGEILKQSSLVYRKDKNEIFTDEIKNIFLDKQEKMSADGMRFIAIAYKDTNSKTILRNKNLVDRKELNDIVFVGLIGFSDPIRTDARSSIREAQNAGARVIMLTGDSPETALKIARDSGIAITKKETAILGSEIEKYNDQELLNVLKENNIFARILPSEKLRIAKVLRASGEIIAMTGDGINDAPALQNADIGIAIGSGTEVAKEASDLILLNDSFSVIVRAIEEGRRIMDNLKKIILHLTSASFSEVFLIGGALILGAPLPILPAQILWINIIGHGFLNFSFAFEPAEKDIMKRNPNLNISKNLMSREIKKMILMTGIITALFTLVLFMILRYFDVSNEELRTIMFLTLSLDSILFSFSIKNLKKPLWKINIFSNKFLNGALILSVIALFGALKFEPLRNLLQLAVLNSFDLWIILFVALFNLFTIEIVKYFIFWRKNYKIKIRATI